MFSREGITRNITETEQSQESISEVDSNILRAGMIFRLKVIPNLWILLKKYFG